MQAIGTINSPELSALIFHSMQAIDQANNGYATLPDNPELARAAGYTR